jgi:hypothetical protein
VRKPPRRRIRRISALIPGKAGDAKFGLTQGFVSLGQRGNSQQKVGNTSAACRRCRNRIQPAAKALTREETQSSMEHANLSSAEAGSVKEVEASESNGAEETAFKGCRRSIARWKTGGDWKQVNGSPGDVLAPMLGTKSKTAAAVEIRRPAKKRSGIARRRCGIRGKAKIVDGSP